MGFTCKHVVNIVLFYKHINMCLSLCSMSILHMHVYSLSRSLSLSFSHTHTHIVAQLLQEAQNYAQVTPLQVSFLFDLCSMEEKTTGAISVDDFTRLLPRPPTISYKTSESMPPVDVVSVAVCTSVSLCVSFV